MSLKFNGEQQSQLDLTNYTQGIYLLTINNQQTLKVIKQ
ncbi:hypothetical protein JCM19314_626 [Nonlabens ulvanivorans]|uniref:Secretion system C-terminal sorting domain-containing protein n=1 Tax=Nonlabens ulvanivorans TaxID=906888 RepID=A0A090R0F5_NONUL|nr:hypothetical protein JCM19314_626 [Nonlabens ulvanivorans]